ncbi:MAG: M28 family peptidase [Methanothrix sp.]|nr:MAG: M28 family peptidase [Methanothrix sp.]
MPSLYHWISRLCLVEEDQGNHTSTNDAASHEYALMVAQVAVDFTSLGSKYTNIWSSDYMPFEWRGYVVAGAYQSGNDPAYHTVNDLPNHVDMDYVAEVTKMILATVIMLAGVHTGSGLVFNPDPITTSGDRTLSNSSPIGLLDAQRKSVTLQKLKPPTASYLYNLKGLYVDMIDIDVPHITPPASFTGEFKFSYADDGFRDVMAYYHINAFQQYIQSLGFSIMVDLPLNVDAHGQESHYDPLTKTMILAARSTNNSSVDEDANSILNYYGRAILDNQKPGFDFPGGLSIGFGDFLGAVFFDDKHADPTATRGLMSPWYSGHAPPRRYDRPWKFGGPESVDDWSKGELWASVLFEIYCKLGGDSPNLANKHNARDLAIKLHLDANFVVPGSTTTETQMAMEILKADLALQGWHGHLGGLHSKVIYEAFHSRMLEGFKENLTPTSDADVYIDDSRKGKYNWLEDPWHPKDICTRLKKDGNLIGNDAHQKPILNKPAYVYVKVRNLGTKIAKVVTVKAYYSVKNAGQIWPNDFTPMEPKAIALLGLLPDSLNPKGSIVGPFKLTPTATSEGSLLIILDCDQDQALTQFIVNNVDTVHLARFDNNIAQRNLMTE